MLSQRGLHVRPAQAAHAVLHNPSLFCLPQCRSSTRQTQQHSSSSSCGQHSFLSQPSSSQLSSPRACSTACNAIGNGHSSNSSSMAACSPLMLLPMGIMTDSYKASHFLQYPQARKMVAVSQTTHSQQLASCFDLSSSACTAVGLLIGCRIS